MLREAVRTIQRRGAGALTLRAVGERLGVSRTALYRHFENKDALLAAVADEGFRLLRQALVDAWQTSAGTRAGLTAMGHAYVGFALGHPSHYRVMFGGVVRPDHLKAHADPATDAFGALVTAIVALQARGLLRQDEPTALGGYIWAVVHGIAMLALDGVIGQPAAVDVLTRFSLERLWSGIIEVAANGQVGRSSRKH